MYINKYFIELNSIERNFAVKLKILIGVKKIQERNCVQCQTIERLNEFEGNVIFIGFV